MAGANLFNSVRVEKNKKNLFDLSHDVKLSCNMGDLVPTLCLPCIPGDKIDISCEMFVRMAAMLAPVMHRYDVSAHYFFVPYRLLWDNWEKYIRNGSDNGTGVPAHPFFTIQGDGSDYTKLMDYLGIPPMGSVAGANPDQTVNTNVNALPFAAYQSVWFEYFRDQNVLPSATHYPKLADGDNSGSMTSVGYTFLRKRAWEHDYFTSALPFSQRGPAVNMPLVFDDVRVMSNQTQTGAPFSVNNTVGGGTTTINNGNPINVATGNPLYAETSQLTGSTTINDLRRAIKLQEWFERMAVGGARYAEQLYAFFNVRNQDARLQRPEYIVGVKNPIAVSEVLNTTGTVDAPQGAMAGHGMSVANGKWGHYFVPEHGYLMCIMSVMPKTCYQQGIPKDFLKINDFTDHYWPQFANIGEQPVLEAELYGFTTHNNDTFGYTPRYAEYKYMPSRVCGQFRTTLNYWHSGRIFGTRPVLNQAFIESDATKRIFAVTSPDDDSLYCHVLHQVRAVRQMPKYGTPSI